MSVYLYFSYFDSYILIFSSQFRTILFIKSQEMNKDTYQKTKTKQNKKHTEHEKKSKAYWYWLEKEKILLLKRDGWMDVWNELNSKSIDCSITDVGHTTCLKVIYEKYEWIEYGVLNVTCTRGCQWYVMFVFSYSRPSETRILWCWYIWYIIWYDHFCCCIFLVSCAGRFWMNIIFGV